jgi:IS5 family transposase
MVRLSQVMGPDVLKQMLARLVQLGVELKLVRGTKLRVDTTVVETNVHYPTDSTLLADGVRVLTRTMKKMGIRFRDRTRSVAKRVYEISQLSRKLIQEPARMRMQAAYRELMTLTRAVVREAETAAKTLARAARRSSGESRTHLQGLVSNVEHTAALVRRVLAQTRARVLKGDTHYKDKLLSLFETHTEAIRKGKAAKPTEFGKLVKIQEAERFITDYQVCATRIPDQDLWAPSLAIHSALFARPPRLAAADAGFASRRNEHVAHEMGVRRVVLPVQGKLHSHERWFRRGLRWRTGCEGRISTLKRRHGLRRCRYRGQDGIDRWVGLGVIADNLEVLGRALPATA